MGKYKTSYSTDWENTYKWIKKYSDKASALCKICNVHFKIDNAGLGQVKAHEKSNKHIRSANILAGNSSQSTFRAGSNSELEMSKGKIFVIAAIVPGN